MNSIPPYNEMWGFSTLTILAMQELVKIINHQGSANPWASDTADLKERPTLEE